MKLKLLIASDDMDYAEHLSKRLSENHSDIVDVNVCSSNKKLKELLKEHKYDVALLETSILGGVDLCNIHLPLALWEDDDVNETAPADMEKTPKYRRVSSILAKILEQYAKVSMHNQGAELEKAKITAVWSPAGGVGKTTVALALAARESSQGKQVMYMNLESFSSTSAFFETSGKSISTVFEMLEAEEGNVSMMIQSILCHDPANNIAYFCCPEDFDDMNILSVENVSSLISACSALTEELIIDMSSICDERAQSILEIADRILLVTDWTSIAQNKLMQFTSRHKVFANIKEKSQIVANKGANVSSAPAEEVIFLPLVQSTDASLVYKTLSSNI